MANTQKATVTIGRSESGTASHGLTIHKSRSAATTAIPTAQLRRFDTAMLDSSTVVGGRSVSPADAADEDSRPLTGGPFGPLIRDARGPRARANHHDGARRVPHDVIRDAAEDRPAQPAPTVTADDDEIGALRRRGVDDRRGRVAEPDEVFGLETARPAVLHEPPDGGLGARADLVDALCPDEPHRRRVDDAHDQQARPECPRNVKGVSCRR